MSRDLIFSVSELNEYVRRSLAGDPVLSGVGVRGEISGFVHHTSGHMYFTLKDDQARVKCVMFRQYNQRLGFRPRDGMRVRATGSASLFVRDGSFQLYIESLLEEGQGELFLRFEALKKKLMAEGLFDAARKRPIPLLPRRVGVVTSRDGAALRDILRVISRRYPGMGVLLSSAAVQGPEAAGQIVSALERLNRRGGVDVILLGRGGGSYEDLWPFNEEIVARAICESAAPVISCVGHETDFTIADFAADLRAATPSMAAELAVPLRADMDAALMKCAARLRGSLGMLLRVKRERLNRLAASPAFRQPGKLFVGERQKRLDELSRRAEGAARGTLKDLRAKLSGLERSLRALGPEAVVERGYALIEGRSGVVTRVQDLETGDEIRLHLRGGSAGAKVTSIRKDEKDAGKEKAGL